MTLKGVEGSCFELAFQALMRLIEKVASSLDFLEKSNKLEQIEIIRLTKGKK